MKVTTRLTDFAWRLIGPLASRLGLQRQYFWLIPVWLTAGLFAVAGIYASVQISQAPAPVIFYARPSLVYSADSVLLARFQTEDYAPPITLDSLPEAARQALIVSISVDYDTAAWHFASYPARRNARVLGQRSNSLGTLQQLWLAMRLDQTQSQTALLNGMLNFTELIGGKPGLRRAARLLFDRAPQQLSLPEAALLVGMMKSPSAYSPQRNPEAALKRRNEILTLMQQRGFLTPAQVDSLKQQPVKLKQGTLERQQAESLQPYFTRYVEREMKQALKRYADSTGQQLSLETDGLTIYTTLDTRYQQHAEDAVNQHMRMLQEPFTEQLRTFAPWRKDTAYLPRLMRKTERWKAAARAGMPEKEIKALFDKKVKMNLVKVVADRRKGRQWGAGRVWMEDTLLSPKDSLLHYQSMLQAAVVSVERSTGRLRAWVGGYEHATLPLDHVWQTRRQVGSAFKPFVYAAALASGMTPCTELPNKRMEIQTPEGPWVPENAEGESEPLLSMRCALAFSINRVAVHLSETVGRDKVVDFAHRFGVKSVIKPVPAVALGTSDASVLEMTQAYVTLANYGRKVPIRVVDRVLDAQGRELPLFGTPKAVEVIPAATAYSLIDMLRGVVTFGTAGTIRRGYNLYGIDLAGKTGTTQNHSDGWFMNMTPELVTGIWVGCDDRRVRFQYMYYGRGAMTAMPIGGLYLSKVYGDKKLALPKGKFEPPTGYAVKNDCPTCPDFRPPVPDSTSADTSKVPVQLLDEEPDETLDDLGLGDDDDE